MSFRRPTPRLWPWLLGLLLLGLAVRCVGLTEQALWLDEWVSLEVAGSPISEIVRGEAFDNHTPPLYYLLLHLWLLLVPEGLVGLRSLSVVLDLAALGALTVTVARWIGLREGLAVGAAYALSPFAVRLAQEGRMYPLLMLTVVLCLALALELENRPDRTWPMWALIGAATASLYTHYYAALSLVSLHFVMAWRLRDRRKAARRWWTAMSVSVVLFAPWLPVVSDLLASGGQAFRAFGLLVLPHALLRFTVGFSVMPLTVHGKRAPVEVALEHWPLSALVVVVIVASLAYGLRRARRLSGIGSLLVALVAIPPVLALAISWGTPSLDARYLSICFPFFLTLWVSGLFGDEPSRARAVLAMLASGLFLYGTMAQLRDPDAGATPWREAGSEIRRASAEGALIVVSPSFYAPVVDRLLGSSRHVVTWKGGLPEQPSSDHREVWLVEVAFLSDRRAAVEREGWRVVGSGLLADGNGVRWSRLVPTVRSSSRPSSASRPPGRPPAPELLSSPPGEASVAALLGEARRRASPSRPDEPPPRRGCWRPRGA